LKASWVATSRRMTAGSDPKSERREATSTVTTHSHCRICALALRYLMQEDNHKR